MTRFSAWRIPATGCLAILLFLGMTAPCFAAPIREIKAPAFQEPGDQVGAGGLVLKYKRISGPLGFGGDILVWGVRASGGKTGMSKLGVTASQGSLSGKSLKCDLKMGGFTVEDRFMSDYNLSWLVTLGGGSYLLRTLDGQHVYNRGSFAYVEPILFGLIRMGPHFRLELGAGYTIANTTGVRVEGPCIQAELLIGRY